MPMPVTNTGEPASGTGSYLIYRGDKVEYWGKGIVARMYYSMGVHLGTSCQYYPAPYTEMAFSNEAYFMAQYRSAQSMGGSLENKINSLGLKYLFLWG